MINTGTITMKSDDKSDKSEKQTFCNRTIDEPNTDWNHPGHYHNRAHLVITDLEYIVFLDAIVDFFGFFVQRYLKQTPYSTFYCFFMVNSLKTQELDLSCTCSLFFKKNYKYVNLCIQLLKTCRPMQKNLNSVL